MRLGFQRARVGASAALAVGLLAAGLAGCGDEPEPQPLPQVSEGPSQHTTPKPTWRKKYSKAELAAYRKARDRFAAYERRMRPIYARGKATEEAAEIFEEYYVSSDLAFSVMEGYERKKIRITGKTEVLWSRPVQVDLESDPAVVRIRQCVDLRAVQVFQDGVKLPNSAPASLRTITLGSVAGAPYQVVKYRGPETGDAKQC